MRLLFLLALLGLACLPLHAGHKPPQVLMRVYIQTPGEGLPDTQAHEINVPPDNQPIMIRALPEVTEADLIDVRPDGAGNVLFFFNHSGQVNLDAVTAQNQGRIMVVMIDGYVVYAPLIDQQISSGELVIPHPLTPLIVQLLQERAKQNVAQAKRP
jgi:preprotein translocase subunit SecD